MKRSVWNEWILYTLIHHVSQITPMTPAGGTTGLHVFMGSTWLQQAAVKRTSPVLSLVQWVLHLIYIVNVHEKDPCVIYILLHIRIKHGLLLCSVKKGIWAVAELK